MQADRHVFVHCLINTDDPTFGNVGADANTACESMKPN